MRRELKQFGNKDGYRKGETSRRESEAMVSLRLPVERGRT